MLHDFWLWLQEGLVTEAALSPRRKGRAAERLGIKTKSVQGSCARAGSKTCSAGERYPGQLVARLKQRALRRATKSRLVPYWGAVVGRQVVSHLDASAGLSVTVSVTVARVISVAVAAVTAGVALA